MTPRRLKSVAAEPNSSAAWIAVVSQSQPDNEAHVDRIAVQGTSSATVTDQVALGSAQGVGPRGAASAIACPAARDCWLATQQGWLFHLTDGTQYPQDTDPNFAGVITFRPADAGVPAAISDTGGGGADLTNSEPVPIKPPTSAPKRRSKPIITHIGRSHLVRGTTLVLPFTLSTGARVRLAGIRHGKVVAQARRTFGAGKHSLQIHLNPKHWPTRLTLTAKRTGSGGGGGGGTVST